jgi:hypothetical protein
MGRWLTILAFLGGSPAFAQMGKPSILNPAPSDEIRGDNGDGKNIIRWQTNTPPDTLYQVRIVELDQNPPNAPLGSAVNFSFTPGTVTSEGGNLYSIPFDFNRTELLAMGSGLFAISLRALSLFPDFDQTSDPVIYNKGRPAPDFSMNTDNPAAVTFNVTAGDPDVTPEYTYDLSFVRVGGGSAPGPLSATSVLTSLDQSSFSPLALEPGADYNVTLTVSDTVNAPAAAGQGLAGQATKLVHANAPPQVTIVAPTENLVIPVASVPTIVPFQILATDDGGGQIDIEIDLNGDGTPEATGQLTSGVQGAINVNVTHTNSIAARARGTDSVNLTGAYTTRNFRLNTPPTVSIVAPTENQIIAAASVPTIVPFQVSANDSHGGPIDIEIDLNGDGTPEATGQVASGGTAMIDVTVSNTNPIAARARGIDDDGLAGPYATRNFRVNTPPTVSIVAPTENQIIAAASVPTIVPFQVSANDSHGGLIDIEIDLNGDGTPEATGQVASGNTTTIDVNVTNTNNVAARARGIDDDGLAGLYATRNFRVNTPPTVSIVAPTENQVIPAASLPTIVPFEIMASDSNGGTVDLEIDLDFDGNPEATGQVASGGSTTIDVTVTASNVVALVRGIDSDNLPGPNAVRTFRVNTPPTVDIFGPADGAIVTFTGNPTDVDYIVNAHDDFSANYNVLIDIDQDGTEDVTVPVSNHVGSPATLSFPAAGPYTLDFWAVDGDGAEGPHTARGVVLNDVPQVSITQPADGSRVDRDISLSGATQIDFAGSVADTYAGPISSTLWNFDGATAAGTAATGPQTISHAYGSIANLLGLHTVTFSATDSAGATGMANASFRVNDIPRAWLGSIEPSVYDSDVNVFQIGANTPTTLTLLGVNLERGTNPLPLRLKLTIPEAPAAFYDSSTPPADPAEPHQATMIQAFTFTQLGDATLTFEVGEDFGAQSTTGTLTLNVRVVDPLSSVSGAKHWDRYR